MKDLNKVLDYEVRKQLDMLRFNVLNNAATLMAASVSNGSIRVVTPKRYVDFAMELYDEIVARGYLNHGRVSDSRVISMDTGKVEGKVEYPSFMTQDNFKIGNKQEQVEVTKHEVIFEMGDSGRESAARPEVKRNEG